MTTAYIPLEHFQETDDDFTTSRIRDMPYGKAREAVSLYPANLQFGNMVYGRISPVETILLSNVGYDDVLINKIIVVGDFLYQGPVITKIKIDETIALQIAFCPVGEGPTTGGVYIDAPTAVGIKFITLSGSGVPTEDNLMKYSLMKNSKISNDPVSIANGIYAYIVAGTFGGATVSLQWRVDSSSSWIDIPNTLLSFTDTIYGIPLNTGQARALINNSTDTTSLTITLMW